MINIKKLRIVGIFILVLCFFVCENTSNESSIITVSSIYLGEELWLPVNGSNTITPVINPPNAANKELSWESDNWYLAEVTRTGMVTAIGIGEVTITARARDGSGVFGSITVIIPDFGLQPLESITIGEGDFSLAVGNDKSLSLDIVPNINKQNVTFSSSNTNVAKVNQAGLVMALSPGNAVITAVSRMDSAITDRVTVTVQASSGTMTAQEIFNALKGKKVTTYGWADLYNDGEGLYYTNPDDFILIEGPSSQAKREAFTTAINQDTEKFIIVSGDIDLSDGRISDTDHAYFDQFNDTPPYARKNADIRFNVGSNTAIIGINDARFMFGGLNINNKSNIIIRNVTFWDAHGSTANDTSKPGYSESKAGATALQIGDNGVVGLWVDHCKFTDGMCSDMIRNYNHDGGFDIKKGQFVTCSWTEFTNHDKVMLVGSSDGVLYQNPLDRQITLHHNYFHGTTQRMPRTRGTQMHVYSNYYNNIGVQGNSGYCLGPGVAAQFVVEYNYFGALFGGDAKITSYYDTITNKAKVYSSGNNKNINPTVSSKPWMPAYVYSVDAVSDLPDSIPQGAGPILVFYK
jgi:pectate lyase